MKKNNSVINIVFQVSAILIICAAIVYLFSSGIAKYLMIVGVVGYTVTTFTLRYPGKGIRGKRLFNIRIIATVLMVVAAYLMFVRVGAWIVILLIAALLTLYTAIMVPYVLKKEEEDNRGENKN